jgi:protein-S-isoprenylcysteine O-methyltransferase Ste14
MAIWQTPQGVMYLTWIVWAVSWLLAAVWSSQAAVRLGFGAETTYRVFTFMGFVFLFFTGPAGSAGFHGLRLYRLPMEHHLIQSLWTLPAWAQWAMVGVTAAGFLFAWWARIHLGALWSGSVTKKADHRIVDTGPYGLVRHPIYTGLIAAAFAMAAIKATPIALAGAAIMTFGYWLKAKMEEGFLRQELGAEAYDAYRKRTPMLVPFSPI